MQTWEEVVTWKVSSKREREHENGVSCFFFFFKSLVFFVVFLMWSLDITQDSVH